MRRQFPIRPRTPGSNLNISITMPRAVVCAPPEDCPEAPTGECDLAITNDPDDGLVETTYEFQMTATGGIEPYNWTVTGGGLPPGYSMDSSGYITGSCFTQDIYTFEITVTDASEPACTASLLVDLEVI